MSLAAFFDLLILTMQVVSLCVIVLILDNCYYEWKKEKSEEYVAN